MKFDVVAEFERIDAIRSIAKMRRQLELLGPDRAKEVIQLATEKSEHQFVWSFFWNMFA